MDNRHSPSNQPTAPVYGFARSFLTSASIADAKVTVLENGDVYRTDKNGRFGPIMWRVGEMITLILEKEGFHTTQSATITVPPEGLEGPFGEISFQVPSHFAFLLFSYAMGVKVDENACQVAATVTAYHKTMDDIPQGEPDAKGVLSPDTGIKPFYWGIFEHWPLKDKTNPFVRSLTATSLDGGVGYLNVPPSDKLYTLTAKKPGVSFSEVKIKARKGAFINVSPPHGPMVLEEDKDRASTKEETHSEKTVAKKPGHLFMFFTAAAITGITVAAIGTKIYESVVKPRQ